MAALQQTFDFEPWAHVPSNDPLPEDVSPFATLDITDLADWELSFETDMAKAEIRTMCQQTHKTELILSQE